MYEANGKKRNSFININAACKSKVCNMTYSIDIKNQPDPDKMYIKFQLTKKKHDHTPECSDGHVTQVRGNQRKEIAKTCILSGGSAKATALVIKSDENTEHKPSTRVIQKCKEEYKRKDLLTNDWMKNLHHQTIGLLQGS
jgi:hypothetical protein